jgi:hypothetical protein
MWAVSKSTYYAYCDESRTSQDRYMVFSGIIVDQSSRQPLLDCLREYRNEHRMFAELKWTKVSGEKLLAYKALVDHFFMRCRAATIHFRSVVFDTHADDFHQHQDGDRDLGYYRLMYHFLLNTFCYYPQQSDSLHVYLDERNSKQSLGEFRNILNSGMRKKQGIYGAVKTIEPVVSHDADIIQMADVLMGAIGYQRNDRHVLPTAKKPKILLADYIAKRAGLVSLKQRTPFRQKHFEIWPFSFRPK